jgi:hypothetical protein
MMSFEVEDIQPYKNELKSELPQEQMARTVEGIGGYYPCSLYHLVLVFSNPQGMVGLMRGSK